MKDKNELKESLSIEEVFNFIADLGGEPVLKNNTIICKTICHNPLKDINSASHKLYYYNSSHLFHCYTGCENPSFDIFELVQKVKKINDGVEWNLPNCINFVLNYFGLSLNKNFDDEQVRLQDWEILNKYDKINSQCELNSQRVEMKIYDDSILKHMPRPRIEPWEKENISPIVLKSRNICYNPVNDSIIIPHYDIDGDLIGIRERTLIKENEEYGKYKPAIISGKMYNHALGFNLYNLNFSKNNIKINRKAIVYESEKSCLKSATYFNNDISVAVCGSSFTNYQFNLLKSLDVEEIIIAFDRQYKELNDNEFKQWVKKLKEIYKKFSPYITISFMFDKENLLGYKDSPIDCGKEVFLELFKKRIYL